MKKVMSMSVMAVLVVGVFATTAAAQVRVAAKANIPFSFTVNERTFDAGTYVVRQIGANIMRVEDTTTHVGVTLLATPAVAGSGNGKLMFRRYGSQNFLSAVVAPEGSYGIELSTSAAEREVAKTMPGSKGTMIAVNFGR